ncbi:MAG TPA: hypothetical protein PLQ80_10370 [Candidatus Syntrophosphaera sp.]|nr:hypothetical protein [Candidatus Syntrophosphaera sp.]
MFNIECQCVASIMVNTISEVGAKPPKDMNLSLPGSAIGISYQLDRIYI